MTALSKVALPELPSLTGLRYWAAFSILLNHLLLGFVARDNAYFSTMLNTCGFLGMNVFFVLSGFIIHYNYHQKLEDFRLSSFYEFILARFARLYPLYIVIFCVELTTVGLSKFNTGELQKAFVLFLTMSQTWFYWKLETGQSVPYMFDRFSLSWSISTEFLMYCGYPALLWIFLRDKTGHKTRIVLSIAVCLAASLFIRAALNNIQAVDAITTQVFGPRSAIANGFTHSSAWWLVWTSPYLRFFEFIVGAVVAHNFLRLRHVPVGPREGLIMPLVGLLAFLFIVGTFIPRESQPAIISETYKHLGYFPFIALIVFVCARYDFALVTRFFEVRFFVFFGECSYSMYLIHIFIYSLSQQAPAGPFETITRIIVLWTTVFACSFVLYTYLEMPARRWVRNALTRTGRRPDRQPQPA